MRTTQTIATLLLSWAAAWHLFAVLAPTWVSAKAENHAGRDFASYYYAVQVAWTGEDPYLRSNLGSAGREEGTRRAVHPFIYPPPFVLALAWVQPMSLYQAFRAWFWVNELAALGCLVVLALWWRPLHPLAPAVLATLAALLTALVNNHAMGQANLPVLFVVLLGLYLVARGWQVPGGALVGIGCMLKMSPALFVALWLLERKWKPAIAACMAALLVSLASLPLVPFAVQLRFFTEVLPGFANGDYNGLSVPIDMFGNHGVPNLWAVALDAPGARRLSSLARLGSSLTSLALVLGVAAAFRTPSDAPWTNAARVSAIGVLLLMPTVYTYEHHVVWAWPAAGLAVLAVITGRLPLTVAPVVAIAVAAWAWDLQGLKLLAGSFDDSAPAVSALIREAKFVALLVLLSACVWVGRAGAPAGHSSGGQEAA